MRIERDPRIEFHEAGTLVSVTRWIRNHDEGIAEWLKNVRRAYQPDRANVAEQHRVALLLFKDSDGTRRPGRIGLLDVGGATLEDVTEWSTWMDPEASGRGARVMEEETQGNGGKAYMFKLFKGTARILGVRDRKLNCKGFDGPALTVERGTPGFIPDAASARDLPNVSWEAELERVLRHYDMTFVDLPKELQRALREREAFTLVEGIDPIDCYKGRIDAENLIERILRHDQATLAVQQLRLYAIHNNQLMRSGRPLELEPIKPYPGFEKPVVHEIPPELSDDSGKIQSTTLNGTRPKGRLILYTSAENMPTAFKKLKPRWKVTYRTQHQMVGSKSVAELAPGIPGSNYVYATVELSALEPDYVELGRIRPGSGPLMQALDRFVAEQIRELAKNINDCRKQEQDQSALDEVHEENRRLDNFKNRFLPVGEFGAYGSGNGQGPGPWPPPPPPPEMTYGEVPDVIEITWESGKIFRIAKGAHLDLSSPTFTNCCHRAALRESHHVWVTNAPLQLKTRNDMSLGISDVRVLLTPRNLEIPVGERKQIIAEVTSDDGQRSTDVFLNWKHDADDQLIVRIHPTGFVSGNRTGKTGITAGAGNPEAGGVWARICAEVTVVPNPKELERGGGFPQLLLTERDIDPATGEKRPSNPDQPALWQEVTDYQYNVWWLNVGAPDAAFLFQQRDENASLWRAFHAQKLVDMVVQVHMQQEFTRKGDAENKDYWASHKQSLEIFSVLLAEPMWRELRRYVQTGSGLN